MKVPRLTGRRRLIAASTSLVVAAAVALTATLTTNAGAAEQTTTDLYVVQIAGDPVASYSGGVNNIPATQPRKGEKVKAHSPAAQAYRQHLESRHRDVRGQAGVADSRVERDLTVSFNGFTARLTADEVARLERSKDVVKVWPNETVTVDTMSTPEMLGLTGDDGVWQEHFGGAGHAGEGVIVGILDTGFTPENPSFGPLPEPRPDQAIIDANGTANAWPASWSPSRATTRSSAPATTVRPAHRPAAEFRSPRDYNGHGSHTGSTAAGNNNVAGHVNGATSADQRHGAGGASGVLQGAVAQRRRPATPAAPRWTSSAAIDDAVADGVDVINYSISGSGQFIVDAVEIAFLFAADAGVFVAASAGNNGDTTAQHRGAQRAVGDHRRRRAPTTAASPRRSHLATVHLHRRRCRARRGQLPADRLDGGGLAGAPALAVRLCFSDADNNPTNGVVPVLDPALVAGKIVICERGVNARIDKSLAVANAGGVGMIQYNPVVGQSFNGDLHSVPSMHVDPPIRHRGQGIRRHARARPPPSPKSSTYPCAPRRWRASRRPVRPSPAAVTCSSRTSRPRAWTFWPPTHRRPAGRTSTPSQARRCPRRTSPASRRCSRANTRLVPDVDQVGADDHRRDHRQHRWANPAGRRRDAVRLRQRARGPTGGVQPGPGLRLGHRRLVPVHMRHRPAPADRWGGICASLPPIDPSDFNGPSIAIGGLAGTQTITRTVKNIDTADAGVYRAEVSLPGFNVTVSPKQLSIPPGQSRTFTVTMTRTTAPIGAYAFGRLSWVPVPDRGVAVSSSIAVRPVPLAAPAERVIDGTNGTVTVSPGYTGSLSTSTLGLIPATVTSFDLDTAGPNFISTAPVAGPQVGLATVTVPAGTPIARFATFDADFPGVRMSISGSTDRPGRQRESRLPTAQAPPPRRR